MTDDAGLHLQPDRGRWLPVVDPIAVDLRYSYRPLLRTQTADLIRKAEGAGVVVHHLAARSVPAGALLDSDVCPEC